MSSPAAFDAIHDYLVANWNATPLHFENEDWDTAASPAALLYVEIFSSIYDQASIGAGTRQTNLWREDGTVSLHVLVPNNTGTSAARSLAKLAADLFRGDPIASMRFGQISLGAGEPGERDGNYYRMTATIDWERDD